MQQQDHQDGPGDLKRVISLKLLVLYGLGTMIGAGIYVLIGATAASAGVYAPLSFIIAGSIAGLTAASYSELASRYPVSAGEARYMDAAFDLPGVALVTGAVIALGATIASALLIKGGAGYLTHLLPFTRDAMAPVLVLAIGAIAVWGIRQSITLAALLTLLEIGGLLLIVIAGLGPVDATTSAPLNPRPPLDLSAMAGIFSASLLAFFAFTGFQDMVNVAEEVIDPKRTIPRALAISLAITTILYVAVVFAAIKHVPIADLSATATPLTLVFERATALNGQAVSAIAVAAVLNGALIHFVMASRMVYGLSRMGALPSLLGTIFKPTGTPMLATVLITALTLLWIVFLPFRELAESTSAFALLGFALVNIALWRIKRAGKGPSDPDLVGTFTVPIWVPIAGVLTSLGLLAYVAFEKLF